MLPPPTDLPLADLEAFAAVARHRSFRTAAQLRGQSPSTLSEALRRLEARLDVRLLNRTTRSVTPTEIGLRLLERLAPALAEVADALDAAQESARGLTGTLRLNVPVIVARLVLPDIVVPFLQAHPGLTLEVQAQDSFVDVLAAGFDAGVRYDERVERDMIAVPIGPRQQRYMAAAAPSYLAARGVPHHPRDLLKHACLRYRFASGVTPTWEFERPGEVVRITPAGPLVVNTLDLTLHAATAGLGVVCTFEGLLADAVASGALRPVLEEWSMPFSGPFLYYPSRRHVPPPLRAFIDFVRRQGRTAPPAAAQP